MSRSIIRYDSTAHRIAPYARSHHTLGQYRTPHSTIRDLRTDIAHQHTPRHIAASATSVPDIA
eukprot:3933258-Rhodomonas_salina.1